MTVFGNNGLRTFGSLSYGDVDSTLSTNGVYEFPPTYTLTFNSKPEMSDNGISVKYNKNELTVRWFLPYEYIFNRNNPANTPDGITPSPKSIDTAVQQIRAVLMQPRKTLFCTYQGLGPTNASESYGMRITKNDDVNFGPIPTDFKWKNLAAQQCVEMSWTVVFHTYNQIIFDSQNNIIKNPSIFTELSWSRSYDIDELGSVTVTTTGRYSIVSNCNCHTDSYRFVAAFPVPVYCQRVSQKFQHDPNSKSTTFTIIDKQHPIENALPPKCLKMNLSHEVSSSLFGGGKLEGKGFHRWNNVIHGDITLPPGEPFITAYLLFWFYARQRLYRVEKGGIAEDTKAPLVVEDVDWNGSPIYAENKPRSVITKVSYKESLFDRTHNFRVEYAAIYDRDKLIQQSGLFTPLYNFKFDKSGSYKYWYELDTSPTKSDREPWSAGFTRPTSSTSPYYTLFSQWIDYQAQFGPNHPNYSTRPFSAWSVYGYTALNEDGGPWVFYPDDQPLNQVRINTVGSDPTARYGAWVEDPAGINESQAYSQPSYEDLDPKASYITHENTFSVIEDVNTFQVVRQTYDSTVNNAMRSYFGDSPPTKSSKNISLHNAGGATTSVTPPESDYVSSYNSQPITTVLMSGYAVRVGFPPSIPTAFNYKGSSLIRSGQSIVSVRQIGKGRMPVYLATWSIPYYANTSVHSNFFVDLKSTGFAGGLT